MARKIALKLPVESMNVCNGVSDAMNPKFVQSAFTKANSIPPSEPLLDARVSNKVSAIHTRAHHRAQKTQMDMPITCKIMH